MRGSNDEVCLVNTSNDSLTRRLFRISITLFVEKRIYVLLDFLTNSGCFEANAIINDVLILMIYEQL